MSDFLDHPTSIRSGEELPLATLDAYLRNHFPAEAGALAVRQFPSGHSNLTYLASSRRQGISSQTATLRQQSEIRARYEPRISRSFQAPLRLPSRSRGAFILRRQSHHRRALLFDGANTRNHSSAGRSPPGSISLRTKRGASANPL